MKRDFRALAYSVVGDALLDPVSLPQTVQQSPERAFYPQQEKLNRGMDIRHQDWLKQQARIAPESRDQLFRRSFADTPERKAAVSEIAVDSSTKSSVSEVLRYIDRAIYRSRAILRRLFPSDLSFGALEQALLEVIHEFQPASAQCRAFVTGKSKVLDSPIQSQMCLIGREALVNALHHSQATLIEIEVEYRSRGLRLVIRDNGCGIDPEVVKDGRTSHRGFLQMEERARSLGAVLRIWTRRGLGTEIEVSLPAAVACDSAA